MLRELETPRSPESLPEELARWVAAGLARSKTISCFDFVPSSAEMVYQVLRALPAGRWCEWGSGIGVNTGIAACCGHRAVGIEIDPPLAAASRQLLAEFGIEADILEGDYYEQSILADYYYVYCWPSQIRAVEEHFERFAPPTARLLICYGAEDVRSFGKGDD